MGQIARFMRTQTCSSGIIEPYFELKHRQSHHILDGLFEATTIVSRIPLAPTPLIVCSNTSALFDLVAKQHGRAIRAIHHGVDSGQIFLKFDLTIEFETKSDSSDISDQARRRVIIIAICPEVAESNFVFAESNFVFAEVYNLLRLPVDQHFHSFHADLKATAYATGIGGGSSSHSCPYCYIEITVSRSLLRQMACGTLRSCAANRHYYKKYLRTQNAAAAQFFNFINDPLQLFPQKSPVISWCRLPQFHLHLHLNWYIHAMVRLHHPVVDWYRHFHQKPSYFHGGDFQGPQLHRLTKDDSMTFLKRLLDETEAVLGVILLFNAMRTFVALKKLCFSKNVANDGFKVELKAFKTACLLDVKKIPLKMHIIIAHLDHAIRETGSGLGANSEQA